MTKDTNPKAPFGDARVPMSTVPATVMAELAVALLEGALKYGRHNYRIDGCRASTYYDATMRHLMSWWEGEDIDRDSGVHHVTKAIASLAVLRDAMILGKVNDDRPPPAPGDLLRALNAHVVDLRKMFPNPKEPYTHDATFSEDDLFRGLDGHSSGHQFDADPDSLRGDAILKAEAAAAPPPEDPLEGITIMRLGDPLALHNAVAEAVGEPPIRQGVNITVEPARGTYRKPCDGDAPAAVEIKGAFDRTKNVGPLVYRRTEDGRIAWWRWDELEGTYVRAAA